VLPLQVRARIRVRLRLRLGLGLIFYVYFVSTKPTALWWCVTVTSQVRYYEVFKFQDPQA